jgi:isochorismate hydrolase
MNSTHLRSPDLLDRHSSLLLVVDAQQKLLKLIPSAPELIWNISRLARAANLLKVPIRATEQYPERLGATDDRLQSLIGATIAKRMFSCRECSALFEDFKSLGIRQIVICGIESHVCILQTALDLMANGFSIFLVADAVGARHTIDHETALRRIEICGGTLVTTEAVMFEWCETSTSEPFKEISKLVTEARLDQ